MANKKNRKNKKYSTHKSKKRRSSGIGQGSRVVNVEKLTKYTERMNEHATRCIVAKCTGTSGARPEFTRSATYRTGITT